MIGHLRLKDFMLVGILFFLISCMDFDSSIHINIPYSQILCNKILSTEFVSQSDASILNDRIVHIYNKLANNNAEIAVQKGPDECNWDKLLNKVEDQLYFQQDIFFASKEIYIDNILQITLREYALQDLENRKRISQYKQYTHFHDRINSKLQSLYSKTTSNSTPEYEEIKTNDMYSFHVANEIDKKILFTLIDLIENTPVTIPDSNVSSINTLNSIWTETFSESQNAPKENFEIKWLLQKNDEMSNDALVHLIPATKIWISPYRHEVFLFHAIDKYANNRYTLTFFLFAYQHTKDDEKKTLRIALPKITVFDTIWDNVFSTIDVRPFINYGSMKKKNQSKSFLELLSAINTTHNRSEQTNEFHAVGYRKESNKHEQTYVVAKQPNQINRKWKFFEGDFWLQAIRDELTKIRFVELPQAKQPYETREERIGIGPGIFNIQMHGEQAWSYTGVEITAY